MTELDECGCLTGGYLFVLGVGLVFRFYTRAYNRALGSFRLWQHKGNKNSVVVMTTTTEYLLFLPQKMRKIYNLLTFNPVYFIMASLSLHCYCHCCRSQFHVHVNTCEQPICHASPRNEVGARLCFYTCL